VQVIVVMINAVVVIQMVQQQNYKHYVQHVHPHIAYLQVVQLVHAAINHVINARVMA